MPTYPSIVLYSVVDKSVIPDDTYPIEMLIGNPKEIDESEVTAYILSIDDRTLCAEDEHTVLLIGPSFVDWNLGEADNGVKNKAYSTSEYRALKNAEMERLIDIAEKRYPGFRKGLRYSEVATPKTIERYCMKRAVAGPKQMLGQHMFKRLPHPDRV